VGLLSITPMSGMAVAAKKVIVISGISETNARSVETYLLVHEGIREGLMMQGIKPEFQYVELEAMATDALKTAAGVTAIATAKASHPDLIITLDDDCLRFIGSRIDDLPVVFAFVWGQPETLGLPKPNVTGIIRRSYAADTWAMARQLTGATTVALISKKNVPMEGVKLYLTAGADHLEKVSGVRFKDMFLVDTFSEWEQHVKNFQAGFIYLGDTSRIKKDGHEMKPEELIQWTVANATVPVVGADVKTTEAGALFSIVTSEKAIGLSAAETALKILGGTEPSSIPYVSSSTGKLVVNAKTAQKYKIDIPYEVLYTAEKIYE
jgi:ABC-type uncharacterized transport system substrate-binding protein